ncbi:LysR family transcriptional regulator [Archangium violaceum]|uniref:LysR family transcriptional regulator n=1 Tax=Archangium violaceum TaxID=83451 RepID=UPI0019515C7A|nr:LysR family transcriptional regulator [Archangium violaceum]QRO02115.1 LysR family transcriptional regulator [Archangium violaceum]
MTAELQHLQTFVRVVERGSLSAVARELGVGQSTISRHLSALEASVGTPLLHRTTRHSALTEAGTRYYEEALRILELVDRAGEAARAAVGTAAGRLRVTCSSAFGILHVTRWLLAFQAEHPGVSIDLSLTDERADLVRDGFDLAIRIGTLHDSALVARKLGEARRVVVAAPAYLARHGTPRRPEDLARHNAIRFAGRPDIARLAFAARDGGTVTVRLQGDFEVNHGLAIREALLAGRGLAVAHWWLVADLVERGDLSVVLSHHRLATLPIHLLTVRGARATTRLRLLVDHLVSAAATIPGLERGGP